MTAYQSLSLLHSQSSLATRWHKSNHNMFFRLRVKDQLLSRDHRSNLINFTFHDTTIYLRILFMFCHDLFLFILQRVQIVGIRIGWRTPLEKRGTDRYCLLKCWRWGVLRKSLLGRQDQRCFRIWMCSWVEGY